MSDGVDWEAVIMPVLLRTWEIIHARLVKFRDKLDKWLNGLLAGPIPENWREELARFVDETRADGLVIKPESIAALAGVIQGRVDANARKPGREMALLAAPAASPPLHKTGAAVAPQVRTLPAPKPAGAASGPNNAPPPSVKPIPKDGQAFFDYKLEQAKQRLVGIQASLKRVQGKLSAARIGDSVDLEADVGEIGSLIIQYNAAMESARQAWLDYDLSGDSNTRMLDMRNPASFGLPAFTSENQRQRAARQIAQIGQRLRARDSRLDDLVFGMQAIEWTTTLVGVAIGVGIVVQAGIVSGKLAAAKVVGGLVTFIVADQAAAYGLRAAGASEQTVNSVRFAAAIVG
jgi:hypothetical protein